MRKRRRLGGFIILFGSRGIVSNDSATPVRAVCPRCGRDVEMQGKHLRNWFTFFFIPIFPISRKRAFTQCPQCGGQFPLAPEQLRQHVQASEQQQNQQSIALFNSLRASPANSITLDQLMKLYAAMHEYSQAISAASEFPQALHNSEQCMTTLGRVFLAQNNFTEATKWFDAAIERNAQLGEAQYYKSLAHLLAIPPNYPVAISAARAARNAGYPDADSLLRQAESKARGE
jgi:tetratricopeptide (TPR) repeat protein